MNLIVAFTRLKSSCGSDINGSLHGNIGTGDGLIFSFIGSARGRLSEKQLRLKKTPLLSLERSLDI